MIWILLAVVNVLAFALMGIDKWKARRNAWRIPEKTLFLAAGMFGALGGVLGMQVFRHKTKHKAFVWGFPAMLAVQVVLMALLLYAVY